MEEYTISTEKAHLQCREGCAIRIRHIISVDEGVEYMTTKTVVFIWTDNPTVT